MTAPSNVGADASREWQPIETAPKDGVTILITDGRSVAAGCWAPQLHGDDFAWAFVDDWSQADAEEEAVKPNAFRTGSVTHWRPLPTPPAGEAA